MASFSKDFSLSHHPCIALIILALKAAIVTELVSLPTFSLCLVHPMSLYYTNLLIYHACTITLMIKTSSCISAQFHFLDLVVNALYYLILIIECHYLYFLASSEQETWPLCRTFHAYFYVHFLILDSSLPIPVLIQILLCIRVL